MNKVCILAIYLFIFLHHYKLAIHIVLHCNKFPSNQFIYPLHSRIEALTLIRFYMLIQTLLTGPRYFYTLTLGFIAVLGNILPFLVYCSNCSPWTAVLCLLSKFVNDKTSRGLLSRILNPWASNFGGFAIQ